MKQNVKILVTFVLTLFVIKKTWEKILTSKNAAKNVTIKNVENVYKCMINAVEG